MGRRQPRSEGPLVGFRQEPGGRAGGEGLVRFPASSSAASSPGRGGGNSISSWQFP